MAEKVADLLVDVLAEARVRQIYGVSGDALNGFWLIGCEGTSGTSKNILFWRGLERIVFGFVK